LANGDFPISKKELAKAKEYIKGHIALALEDTRNINDYYGTDELFINRTRTPEEVYKEIDKVTREDVIKVAKELFVKKGLNLAVIGPFKKHSKFEKLLL
jgi:predicted Zn-dependent peptidase